MRLELPNTTEQTSSEQLTKTDLRLLDYISNNTELFLFSSIGQLARQTGVSDATISRFVRHVGCRDFKELKQMVMEQVSFEGPAAKMAETINSDKGFTPENWILMQQCHLQRTLDAFDRRAFETAMDQILGAKRIFIHAKSASASVGQLLYFRLRRLGLDVTLLPSGGSEMAEGLAQMTEQDLAVMFSFSKVSREGRMILAYQRKVHYHTLAFTSRTVIPEEERADVNLYVYRGKPKEFHAMTGPAAMVDALAVALFQKMGSDSAKRLSAIHRLKKTYDTMD